MENSDTNTVGEAIETEDVADIRSHTEVSQVQHQLDDSQLLGSVNERISALDKQKQLPSVNNNHQLK